jgi:hypothetical protein
MGVAELPLNDGQRHSFAGHLDGVSVPELVRAKRRCTPACAARRRSYSWSPARTTIRFVTRLLADRRCVRLRPPS